MHTSTNERIYKWDNLKFILIILVVFCHFLNVFETDASKKIHIIFMFVYSFHMPLFLFIAGMFFKSSVNGPHLKRNKVCFFLILYVLLQLMISIIFFVFGKGWSFCIFDARGVAWYLLALALYLCILRLIRGVKPAVVLTVSIVLACLIGYESAMKDQLAFFRVTVFFPFMYLGYLCDPEKLLKYTEQVWLKIICAVGLILAFLFVAHNIVLIYRFRQLLTARWPYEDFMNPSYGVPARLLYYIAGLLMCFMVVVVIPKRKLGILSRFGRRTLSVYFWHMPILYVYNCLNINLLLWKIMGGYWKIVYLAFALSLPFILSLKIFSKPLDWLAKKDYSFFLKGN